MVKSDQVELIMVAIAIAIIPYAHSLGSPARPIGVAADHWVAIGDVAGFVITGVGDPHSLKEGGLDQVKGYFMIPRGRTWARISNEPDLGTYQ
jgi:hypothetical protein